MDLMGSATKILNKLRFNRLLKYLQTPHDEDLSVS